MPKYNGIGFGDCTKLKIEYFSRIISMHLHISQAVLQKNSQYYPYIYRYIELTSGKGLDPNNNIGSPIAFISKAEEDFFQIPYKADFIECNEKNILDLVSNLDTKKRENGWNNDNWEFHCGKYQDKIFDLFKSKSKELGLVFIDPSGDLPDFDIINYISKMRPKMELLIYISSTNIKRTYQYTHMRLIDYINKINKKYWLIRKPISWDKFKWTFLLGSNASLFNNYKSIEFYRIESDYGKTILEELNFTKKERIEARQYKFDI